MGKINKLKIWLFTLISSIVRDFLSTGLPLTINILNHISIKSRSTESNRTIVKSNNLSDWNRDWSEWNYIFCPSLMMHYVKYSLLS